MVDIAEKLDDANLGTRAAPTVESDFSPRKLKIATGVLIGQSFATSILPFSAVSILMIPLTQQFGWTRTEFSFATTFLFIFGAASLWPIGRMADKLGVRPVIIGGTAVVGAITLAMALQTKSLTQLYFYYAMLGVFGSTGVAYMKVIAALFTQNRGKAMAILGAESTIAMALVPLLTNWLVLSFGWRVMYVAFAAIILTAVPILYFTLEEPAQKDTRSLLPWRRKAENKPAPRPAGPVLEGMSIKETLRDWAFWVIVLAIGCGMIMFTGMLTHMVPALIGKGFSQTRAVEMTSVAMLAGLAGTLAGGWAVDRFHTAKIAVPFCLLSALGALLLLIVSASWGGLPMLALAMAMGGFSFNAFRPMGTYFQTRFFGLAAFTEIMAVQFMITNPITAFSAPLIGGIYDRTHSYEIAFILMAASWLVAAALWFALPKYRYAANIGQATAPAKAGS